MRRDMVEVGSDGLEVYLPHFRAANCLPAIGLSGAWTWGRAEDYQDLTADITLLRVLSLSDAQGMR